MNKFRKKKKENNTNILGNGSLNYWSKQSFACFDQWVKNCNFSASFLDSQTICFRVFLFCFVLFMFMFLFLVFLSVYNVFSFGLGCSSSSSSHNILFQTIIIHSFVTFNMHIQIFHKMRYMSWSLNSPLVF